MYYSEDAFQKNNNFDDGFSHSVAAMLMCAEGESYLPIFREQNIGIQDMSELSDLDLIILGVDSASVRKKLLDVGKSLPRSALIHKWDDETLTLNNATDILKDNTKHLRRIVLSLISNKLGLIKCPQVDDELLKCVPQCHTSDVILDCCNRIETTISKIEKSLKNLKKQQEVPFSEKMKRKKKKLIIGSFGGLFIVILSIGFVYSLRKM